MFRRKEEEMEGTAMAANDMFESNTNERSASADDRQQDNNESAQDERGASGASVSMRDATSAARPSSPSAALGAKKQEPMATPSFRPQAGANLAPASASRASTPATLHGDPRRDGMKGSKRILTVGNEINMKGEISTCDRLVIEGAVDATLRDVHTVELAESGSFKGKAEIEDAEISGSFDGDLIVRGRLIIYSTGKVRGNISYGEIEIERGGQLTGTISQINEGGAAKKSDDKRVAA